MVLSRQLNCHAIIKSATHTAIYRDDAGLGGTNSVAGSAQGESHLSVASDRSEIAAEEKTTRPALSQRQAGTLRAPYFVRLLARAIGAPTNPANSFTKTPVATSSREPMNMFKEMPFRLAS